MIWVFCSLLCCCFLSTAFLLSSMRARARFVQCTCGNGNRKTIEIYGGFAVQLGHTKNERAHTATTMNNSAPVVPPRGEQYQRTHTHRHTRNCCATRYTHEHTATTKKWISMFFWAVPDCVAAAATMAAKNHIRCFDNRSAQQCGTHREQATSARIMLCYAPMANYYCSGVPLDASFGLVCVCARMLLDNLHTQTRCALCRQHRAYLTNITVRCGVMMVYMLDLCLWRYDAACVRVQRPKGRQANIKCTHSICRTLRKQAYTYVCCVILCYSIRICAHIMRKRMKTRALRVLFSS